MPSPKTSGSTSDVGQTNSLTTNVLVAGTKWGGSAGMAATVSYSFPWTSARDATFLGANGFGDYSLLNEHNAAYHYGLSAVEQTSARNALQSWSNIANITFTEVAETNANVGELRCMGLDQLPRLVLASCWRYLAQHKRYLRLGLGFRLIQLFFIGSRDRAFARAQASF